jgi:hypothetical protein
LIYERRPYILIPIRRFRNFGPTICNSKLA